MCSSLNQPACGGGGRHHHSLCQHRGGSSFLCRSTPPSRPGMLPGPPRPRCLPGPDYRRGELSAEEEKISAWRGHEDNGGEGQLGREPGCPGGNNFFQERIFVNFCLPWISHSLSQVKVKFNLAPFCFSTVYNSM